MLSISQATLHKRPQPRPPPHRLERDALILSNGSNVEMRSDVEIRALASIIELIRGCANEHTGIIVDPGEEDHPFDTMAKIIAGDDGEVLAYLQHLLASHKEAIENFVQDFNTPEIDDALNKISTGEPPDGHMNTQRGGVLDFVSASGVTWVTMYVSFALFYIICCELNLLLFNDGTNKSRPVDCILRGFAFPLQLTLNLLQHFDIKIGNIDARVPRFDFYQRIKDAKATILNFPQRIKAAGAKIKEDFNIQQDVLKRLVSKILTNRPDQVTRIRPSRYGDDTDEVTPDDVQIRMNGNDSADVLLKGVHRFVVSIPEKLNVTVAFQKIAQLVSRKALYVPESQVASRRAWRGGAHASAFATAAPVAASLAVTFVAAIVGAVQW